MLGDSLHQGASHGWETARSSRMSVPCWNVVGSREKTIVQLSRYSCAALGSPLRKTLKDPEVQGEHHNDLVSADLEFYVMFTHISLQMHRPSTPTGHLLVVTGARAAAYAALIIRHD